MQCSSLGLCDCGGVSHIHSSWCVHSPNVLNCNVNFISKVMDIGKVIGTVVTVATAVGTVVKAIDELKEKKPTDTNR